MTTLLVYHDQETSTGYLGADRRESADNTIISDEGEKIVRAGKWLIGNTGYGLAVKLLREHMDALAACATADLLAREIKQILAADGWEGRALDEGQGPKVVSGWRLVASPEGAWVFFGDGALCPVRHPQGAGSGGDLAQGALVAFLERGVAVEVIAESMTRAISIACRYDKGSGGVPQVEVTR